MSRHSETEITMSNDLADHHSSSFYRMSALSRRSFKVILLGDSGVGKSSLFARFNGDSFAEATFATLQVGSCRRTFRFGDREIVLELWDTAGTERMLSLTENYYHHASAAIFLYDVNDQATFLGVQSTWVPSIRRRDPSMTTFLVGNKTDKASTSYAYENVTLDEARRYESSIHDLQVAGNVQVSVKTEEGVQELFESVAEALCGDGKAEEKKSDEVITLKPKNKQRLWDKCKC
ncbi:ras-related protein Rab-6B-like [Branchiostoma lanceolatum]|uniref:ras-related protein Rab-6B-like n=1 Tax=Branchiostoma lanceolatum TaxID=7740 RepID=UPI003456A5A8